LRPRGRCLSRCQHRPGLDLARRAKQVAPRREQLLGIVRLTIAMWDALDEKTCDAGDAARLASS